MRLSFFQALCGTTVYVPTLDRNTIPVPVTSVVKPGSTHTLRGDGMPHPKQPTRRGDLIVEFDVRFPDRLSNNTKEILRDCLPA